SDHTGPSISAMGVGMSSGRQDFAGRTLPLLAVQMLLQYGPAGASRPPLTAALVAANALVYFRPGAVDAHLPRLRHVMFNPHLIIKVPTYTTTPQPADIFRANGRCSASAL
uniref:Uncharacterized protein n=1 Tax=Aegilops tauschii subsp. strangulata TaxID=200361 RepID=A0A453EP96_AEGTS